MHPLFPLDYHPMQWIEVNPGAGAIMAAVNKALPGTDIMVRGGTYTELVKFPSHKGGTNIAPIRLISADGHGLAKVIAPAGAAAAIQGLGVWNIAVIGMDASGGSVGAIDFTLSGNPSTQPGVMIPANYCRRILIQDCIAHDTTGTADGIKVSQADDVQVIGNTVYKIGGQCVDFLAVGGTMSGIYENDLSGATTDAVIFAKGGCQDIDISENHIHDAPGVHGISVGGETGEVYCRPDLPRIEARLIMVTHNNIERVGKTGKYSIAVLGGQYSIIANNTIDTREIITDAAIAVSHGSAFLGNDTWSKELVIGPNVCLVGAHTALVSINKSLPPANLATIKII